MRNRGIIFLRGRQYLNPLKLKDIADEINVHESTVSRAIKDKYIQTDWGYHQSEKLFLIAGGAMTIIHRRA